MEGDMTEGKVIISDGPKSPIKRCNLSLDCRHNTGFDALLPNASLRPISRDLHLLAAFAFYFIELFLFSFFFYGVTPMDLWIFQSLSWCFMQACKIRKILICQWYLYFFISGRRTSWLFSLATHGFERHSTPKAKPRPWIHVKNKVGGNDG